MASDMASCSAHAESSAERCAGSDTTGWPETYSRRAFGVRVRLEGVGHLAPPLTGRRVDHVTAHRAQQELRCSAPQGAVWMRAMHSHIVLTTAPGVVPSRSAALRSSAGTRG